MFKKLILVQFINLFLDENHCIDNIYVIHQKRDSFQKTCFFFFCTYTFEQSPTMHKYFGSTRFFQFIHLKDDSRRDLEHLNFDQCLLNSRSNLHVNLVHSNSLHPQKAILPMFLGQTPRFLGEKLKNSTNNLHHQKALSVAVILSLMVVVQHLQKREAIMLSTRWK